MKARLDGTIFELKKEKIQKTLNIPALFLCVTMEIPNADLT